MFLSRFSLPASWVIVVVYLLFPTTAYSQTCPELFLGAAAKTAQECATANATVGQQIPFQSAVGNSGENPLSNTQLTLTLSAELRFVGGTEGADRGTWTVQDQLAILDLGTMAPGEVVGWMITVETAAPGTGVFMETFSCCDGASVSATCEINVEGGEVLPGSISGLKWRDDNGNGVQDNGEPGLDGVTIFIDIDENGVPTPGEPVAVTANGGFYTLSNLEPTTLFAYLVREVVPAGATQTFPASGFHPVEVASGQNIENINFGNQVPLLPGALGGVKWEDTNGDGNQDTDEEGLDGIVIFIDDNNDGIPNGDERTTTTAGGGFYAFADLEPGPYTVREVIPEGSIQTYPPSGAHTVELAPGTNLENLNFGNQPGYGSIHGRKVLLPPVGEDLIPSALDGVGVDGFTIQLQDLQGTVVDEVETHSMDLNEDGYLDPFSEQGLFWFMNVPPGPYRVVEVQQAGWEQVFPTNDGGHVIELLPGETIPGLLFRNRPFIAADWGDLPDPFFLSPPARCIVNNNSLCYNTMAPEGPVHLVDIQDPNPLMLGRCLDVEPNGQPDVVAIGDDLNLPFLSTCPGKNDEDGIGTIEIRGTSGTVEVAVQGPNGRAAFIDAWIDFDENGYLGDAGEMILRAERVVATTPATVYTLPFTLPPGADATLDLFARFRISYTRRGIPTFSGGVLPSGEVEDYFLSDLIFDHGDARQEEITTLPEFPFGYPVTFSANGARHQPSEVFLGDAIDYDLSGALPTISAAGDDTDLQSDEDGFIFSDGFTEQTLLLDPSLQDPVAGQPFTFHGIARNTTVELIAQPSVLGKLNAWIDFNRDGDWDDVGEQIFSNQDLEIPLDTLYFDIPPDADLGYTYARFRFNLDGNLLPTGDAIDGEVEDYLFEILEAPLGTRFQIINALPASGRAATKQDETVDVYVDNERIADNVAAGSATPLLNFTTLNTSVTVDLTAGDASDNSAPLFSRVVDLSDGDGALTAANTFILTPTEDGSIGLIVKTDTQPSATNSNEVDVFLVHAAPGSPTLDVQLRDDTGAVLTEALSFGETTDYESLAPGVYDLDVRTTDTGALLDIFRLDVTAQGGQSLALVLGGDPVTLVAFDPQSNRTDPPVVTATDPSDELPAAFRLQGNYPNPFRGTTTLRFDLPEAARVHVDVYDVLGRRTLSTPVQARSAGPGQTLSLDAPTLPAGLYVFHLIAETPQGALRQTGRFVVLN